MSTYDDDAGPCCHGSACGSDHDPDCYARPLTHKDCLKGTGECQGAVEYRMPLSGTGKSFTRCDRHWSERLDQEQVTRERYGHPDSATPPRGFDPSYAGESWDEDY